LYYFTELTWSNNLVQAWLELCIVFSLDFAHRSSLLSICLFLSLSVNSDNVILAEFKDSGGYSVFSFWYFYAFMSDYLLEAFCFWAVCVSMIAY